MRTRKKTRFFIDTGKNYMGDYNGLFQSVVRTLEEFSGEKVFSEGNLPSEAEKDEKRNRKYFTESRQLEAQVYLARLNHEDIFGYVCISGLKEEQTRIEDINLRLRDVMIKNKILVLNEILSN